MFSLVYWQCIALTWDFARQLATYVQTFKRWQPLDSARQMTRVWNAYFALIHAHMHASDADIGDEFDREEKRLREIVERFGGPEAAATMDMYTAIFREEVALRYMDDLVRDGYHTAWFAARCSPAEKKALRRLKYAFRKGQRNFRAAEEGSPEHQRAIVRMISLRRRIDNVMAGN
jgi:hypothetical protein